MRKGERKWWVSAGEAIICIVVLAALLTTCAVSARSCVRDICCQVEGGSVVRGGVWSTRNRCLFNGEVR